ncbi:DNA-directed DNA polymerase eta rad30 [Irineochytrium annulatum]|nr:DNA-directed DNA polymerase eta rad30 [Irineochytrium annulatum]
MSECKARTIVHLDLDCFYAQVERRRLEVPREIPLVVRQWNGLLAVDYTARKFGIKRGTPPDEAIKLCPGLAVVHVPTFKQGEDKWAYHPDALYSSHKVSLEPYRTASLEVFRILQKAPGVLEKAGVDEAFLDLSDEVSRRCEAMKDSLEYREDESGDGFGRCPKVDWRGVGFLAGVKKKEVEGKKVEEVEDGAKADGATLVKTCDSMTGEEGGETEAVKQLVVEQQGRGPDVDGDQKENVPVAVEGIDSKQKEDVHVAAGGADAEPKTDLDVVPGGDGDAQSHTDARPAAIKDDEDDPVISWGWSDLHLWIAAGIVKEIRDEIFATCKFTVSGGIAHNKTLAKICSAQNKPFNQTILRSRDVEAFIKNFPLTKIRGLGGKLGAEVVEKLKVTTVGELGRFELKELQKHFGDEDGVWLHGIARGQCEQPVNPNGKPKILSVYKRFRQGINREDVTRWVKVFASELFDRLSFDFEINRRWPKTFTIHFQADHRPSQSKSSAFPSRFQIKDIERLEAVFAKVVAGADCVPCVGMGVTMSNLVVEETGSRLIDSFFDTTTAAAAAAAGGSGGPREMDAPAGDAEALATKQVFTQCEKCGRMIEDDGGTAVEEHRDWHVAMEMQRKEDEESAGVREGTTGKRKNWLEEMTAASRKKARKSGGRVK